VPRRDALVTLVLEGLPRSGPFRLEEGRRAMALAREATERALERPIDGGLVRG
jgi:NTE family protein